jgi:hypothetical protein
MSEWQDTLRVSEYEGVLAEVPLLFLQHEGLVRINFNVDTTTVEEARQVEGFVNQILSRLPSLQEAVATASFKYYLFLVEAFRKSYGDEVQLPVATDAESLKQFYKLTTIYLPNEFEAGYFGLGFECEFEIEHGLGIRFRNWQIEEVGDEEEGFSLD